jgi:hypothetical protein
MCVSYRHVSLLVGFYPTNKLISFLPEENKWVSGKVNNRELFFRPVGIWLIRNTLDE